MTMYNYIECGLNNVMIHGLDVVVDDADHEVVTIPAVNQLHRAIAEGIVLHPFSMSGDELRFLRTEMGLTQAQLANIVHRDRQSVGYWERNEHPMDGTVEMIIRTLAIEQLGLMVDLKVADLAAKVVQNSDIQTIDIDYCPANDNSAQYHLRATA